MISVSVVPLIPRQIVSLAKACYLFEQIRILQVSVLTGLQIVALMLKITRVKVFKLLGLMIRSFLVNSECKTKEEKEYDDVLFAQKSL